MTARRERSARTPVRIHGAAARVYFKSPLVKPPHRVCVQRLLEMVGVPNEGPEFIGDLGQRHVSMVVVEGHIARSIWGMTAHRSDGTPT